MDSTQKSIISTLVDLGKMELRYGNYNKSTSFFKAANQLQAIRVEHPEELLNDSIQEGIGSGIKAIIEDLLKEVRFLREIITIHLTLTKG